MGHKFSSEDITWLYPERPLHLLNYWKEIDHLCRTQVSSQHSRFRKGWLDHPDEFILALIDDRLAAAVHVDIRKNSALCHIVVHPDFQRTNLSWLISLRGLRLAFIANRKGKAHCDIHISNRPAQRLAGALGFKRLAVYNQRITYRMTWHDYRSGVGKVYQSGGDNEA